jgi:hypothetical protein
MSNALDRVRNKFKVPTLGTCKTSETPSAASAVSAGAPLRRMENGGTVVVDALSPAQKTARQQVLEQLVANPTVQRAFANRFENGSLIVTVAVRDVGTCELLIPAERFNSGSLDDYAALLACLGTGRKGATG